MGRRAGAKLDTDMFPFLSVLCSIIGVLMLFLLLIIATRVVATEQPPVVALIPPPPPPPPPPVKIQAGLNEQEYDRLKRRIAELNGVLAERQQELADFRSTVIQAEDMIASKEDEVLRPKAGTGKVIGVELASAIPVDVVLQTSPGAKITKKPLFIEVKAEGYIAHDGRTPSGRFFRASELESKTSPFAGFLADMDRRTAKEYLVLLLHPNGIPALEAMKKYLRETFPHRDPRLKAEGYSRIDTGVEPFSPGWLLIRPKTAEPLPSGTK